MKNNRSFYAVTRYASETLSSIIFEDRFPPSCVYACANCIMNAIFQLMHTIDAKLCSYLMFQNSFRNIQRQNNYHNFLNDRLELWSSTIIK